MPQFARSAERRLMACLGAAAALLAAGPARGAPRPAHAWSELTPPQPEQAGRPGYLSALRARVAPRRDGWTTSGLGAVRGVTVGPIESALHPDRGYGSEAYQRTLREIRVMGGNWVSLTVFGRVWDLRPSGVDPSFEAPHAENRAAVRRAVAQAHRVGLRVMLVPHLWVESGAWRAEIDPGSDEAWARWMRAYAHFALGWAELAREADVELFSVGVELRSWVTSSRAARFVELVREVRRVYPGLVSYAANWDDVEHTVVLGELDVIGINAFYPLAEREGASQAELVAGGERVRARIDELATSWDRPVLFTEFGYTTRPDPALRPWEWPDSMRDVKIDQRAQAEAYVGLLAPLTELSGFAGSFVWRCYADPDDQSQEAEWGFSPRGKLAERTLRDAFATHWAADGPRRRGHALAGAPVEPLGIY